MLTSAERWRQIAAYVDMETWQRLCVGCAQTEYTAAELDDADSQPLADCIGSGAEAEAPEYCDSCGGLLDGYSLTADGIAAALDSYSRAVARHIVAAGCPASMAAVEQARYVVAGGARLAALSVYLTAHGVYVDQQDRAALVAAQIAEAPMS